MGRQEKAPPDPFALHVGGLVRDALVLVAPPAPDPEPPSLERKIAQRRIWRVVRGLPLQIRDAEALAAVMSQVLRAGFEAGRDREGRRIAAMAAKRRSSTRPEIAKLLLLGRTNGQVRRQVPGASERTIDRVRAELKSDGHL